MLAALAGCTESARFETVRPAAVARPVAVVLYRDTVTVRFADGALCAMPRAARSGAWSGRLAGCPHPWPAEVLRPIDLPRVPLSEDAGSPRVVLYGPDGARSYGVGTGGV